MNSSGNRRARGRGADLARLDDLIAVGLAAQDAGERGAAEDAYRKILAVDRTEPRAVQLIGALPRGPRRDRRGRRAVRRRRRPARSADARLPGLLQQLREHPPAAKRLDEAEAMLRELVELAPDEWQPWHNLSQTLKDAERFDEAAAVMRRAIVLAPEHGPNHAVLGDILQKLGRLHSGTCPSTVAWRSDGRTT